MKREYMKSFWWAFTRKDVQFQIKGWSWLPWCHHLNDSNGEIEYTDIFAGWLFIQCRWVHV